MYQIYKQDRANISQSSFLVMITIGYMTLLTWNTMGFGVDLHVDFDMDWVVEQKYVGSIYSILICTMIQYMQIIGTITAIRSIIFAVNCWIFYNL